MSEKHAFLVMGPESSGTRLATRILIDAGCLGGPDHPQIWDMNHPGEQTPIVWRRSFPHAAKWPNIGHWVGLLREHNYSVRAIVTTRDFYSMIQSQIKAGHTGHAVASRRNIQEAYIRIFSELGRNRVGFMVLSYEALVQRPGKVVGWLLDTMDLPDRLNIKIYDGNAKYYEGK